jgi:hypothetical protein
MRSVKAKQDSKKKHGDARKPTTSKPSFESIGLNSSAKSETKFVDDLLIRGEAARQDESGKLPLDATHVIEGTNPDGSVQVKRVRLKAF